MSFVLLAGRYDKRPPILHGSIRYDPYWTSRDNCLNITDNVILQVLQFYPVGRLLTYEVCQLTT